MTLAHSNIRTDFHAAAENVGKPKRSWWRIARNGIIAYGFVSMPFHYYDSLKTDQVPSQAITFGGYTESHRGFYEKLFADSSWVSQEQQKYLNDKAELENVIVECSTSPKSCNPRIAAFAQMIKDVGQVPDRLTQVKLINAYINKIDYDDDEVKSSRTDLDHHTLLEAITLNKVICDEVARLKLFALEKIGFSQDEARWVSESIYINGVKQDSGHAIVEIKIDGQNWIMNIKANSLSYGAISTQQAISEIIKQSKMENDSDHLNNRSNSYWWHNSERPAPRYGFNSTQRFTYVPENSSDNRTSLSAKTELTPHELAEYNALEILASAFTPHYEILKPHETTVTFNDVSFEVVATTLPDNPQKIHKKPKSKKKAKAHPPVYEARIQLANA